MSILCSWAPEMWSDMWWKRETLWSSSAEGDGPWLSKANTMTQKRRKMPEFHTTLRLLLVQHLPRLAMRTWRTFFVPNWHTFKCNISRPLNWGSVKKMTNMMIFVSNCQHFPHQGKGATPKLPHRVDLTVVNISSYGNHGSTSLKCGQIFVKLLSPVVNQLHLQGFLRQLLSEKQVLLRGVCGRSCLPSLEIKQTDC